MPGLTLVAAAATWSRLRERLSGSKAERMAFGYCSASRSQESTRFLLHHVDFPADEDYVVQRASRVVLGAADTIPYLLRSRGAAAFLDAHSHPFPGPPEPSATDDSAALRQYNSLQAPSP